MRLLFAHASPRTNAEEDDEEDEEEEEDEDEREKAGRSSLCASISSLTRLAKSPRGLLRVPRWLMMNASRISVFPRPISSARMTAPQQWHQETVDSENAHRHASAARPGEAPCELRQSVKQERIS